MNRRTTIEIDERLLERAKRALGLRTTRATVEEALRRVAADAEDARARVSEEQA
ncbi:MAG TPA: type II toxin-antitoxin system VapB family antitoxin, partial [Actinomycetota bacterium]|nr:type II toxin-antitoxin system VapB family antitoxin [Actinomycetota bacterium]